MTAATDNLRGRAIAAMERETKAKQALREAETARRDALEAYNDAQLCAAGYVVGSTIVEVPHRYSWDRARGKTEFFVVDRGYVHELDKAVGYVVTKANRKNQAHYRLQSFKIAEAKDTGRVLTPEG